MPLKEETVKYRFDFTREHLIFILSMYVIPKKCTLIIQPGIKQKIFRPKVNLLILK